MPYNYAHKCKTITYVDNFKYALAEKHFTHISTNLSKHLFPALK